MLLIAFIILKDPITTKTDEESIKDNKNIEEKTNFDNKAIEMAKINDEEADKNLQKKDEKLISNFEKNPLDENLIKNENVGKIPDSQNLDEKVKQIRSSFNFWYMCSFIGIILGISYWHYKKFKTTIYILTKNCITIKKSKYKMFN